MLIYAGIDEAGYGPMLGPLCVAGSVFVLPEHDPGAGAPKLWSMLRSYVCRSKRHAAKRICIEDSKLLKGSSGGATHPLLHLERGVLAFLPGGLDLIRAGASDDALLQHLGVEPIDRPWYGSTTTLPVAQDASELRIQTSRLHRGLDRANIRCEMITCRAIDAGPFNDRIDRIGNKAAVNMHAIVQIIDEIWRRFPQQHPRIIVDRQSGRTHYLESLQIGWPDARTEIIAESDDLSRYHMTDGPGRELTVSFVKGAEQRHLPVALASMTAKYVRELLMLRLNRFFAGHLPELKPTAGYVQDGRRFVREIAPVMRTLKIDRRSLIRQV